MTRGQDAFHKDLRALFHQHQGSVVAFAKKVRAFARKEIWNGDLDALPGDLPKFIEVPFVNKKGNKLVDREKEKVVETLADLSDRQRDQYNAMVRGLTEAIAELRAMK